MAKIVTITNPLTGQPAQVDQLDHTAQQIDDGLNIARGVSNPNLLDNWYFGNPVDQRQGYVVPPGTPYYSDVAMTNQVGTTTIYYKGNRLTDTYSEVVFSENARYVVPTSSIVRGYTGAGYTVDRMKIYTRGTALITDNGIHLINTVDWGTQIELSRVPINVPVTLSVLTDKGIGKVTHTFSGATNEQIYTDVGNGVKINALYNWGASGTFLFCLQADDSIVLGMKLELGTQQTLAHQDADGKWVLNEIPNYGEQLRRCQRYFQTFATESLRPTNALDFRPVMRANPALSTITVDGKTLYTASADL